VLRILRLCRHVGQHQSKFKVIIFLLFFSEQPAQPEDAIMKQSKFHFEGAIFVQLLILHLQSLGSVFSSSFYTPISI
jgi:hypothetical protein